MRRLFSSYSDASLALWRLPFHSFEVRRGKEIKKKPFRRHQLSALAAKKPLAPTRCCWCEGPGRVRVVRRCSTPGAASARPLRPHRAPHAASNKRLSVVFPSRLLSNANIFPAVQTLGITLNVLLTLFHRFRPPFFTTSPAETFSLVQITVAVASSHV